jgi:hypothetical protein
MLHIGSLWMDRKPEALQYLGQGLGVRGPVTGCSVVNSLFLLHQLLLKRHLVRFAFSGGGLVLEKSNPNNGANQIAQVPYYVEALLKLSGYDYPFSVYLTVI